MMIKHIMPRGFVTIVTINTEGIKNHGIAHMRNSMQVVCAKIVTSTCTIKRNVKKM